MKTRQILLTIAAVAIAGCSEPNKFEQTFAKPAWFDSVDAPELNTVAQLDALWQSKKHCCGGDEGVLENNRVFYKACYNAITDHYENEEMVVKCLWLMDVGAESKQRVELSRFLIENYPDHKSSVDNCVNCMPGDTIARETLDVAQYESRMSQSKAQPIGRIEALMDSRRNEISYWVQAEIYEFLGKLYLEDGITKARLERFEAAYQRLDRAKDFNDPLKDRFPAVEKMHRLVRQHAPVANG